MNLVKSIETGKKSINRMGILKALLVVVISIFIETGGFFFDGWTSTLGNAEHYMKLVIDVIFKFLALLVILKLFSRKSSEEYKYNAPGLQYYIYIFVMVIGYRLFYEYSVGGITRHIKMNPIIEKAFEELAISPIVLIISIVFIAPIYEEMIFRGIILNGLAKKINIKVAVVISALLFAVMHMNLIQGINTFFLGILFGFIYIKTKSIYLSIFAHFINNSFGIIIGSIIEQLGFGNTLVLQSTVTIIGAIFMLIACLWYNKNAKFNICSSDLS
ncbi:type II CAAX endopeptidase family protein [Clostridium aestuarii]|uniref:Type II CAAX endopeptidase family protein n=1 Tax=Clostridium aestuarii TaxID=338193 RepID=A0ABT4CYP8_9CLOT|nr:type II CAAX endopeptidase family protein [Clostridium aestuarii]MCY6484098.1 type II CAAX endopeptidase family protein [Clostridium aestuarii]